ncbi:ATP-binding protein [Lactobacillus kefiranofaciens]|uniref:ATP-binding protein n=1 Tax=Lactobacillus kefiranofaciens TaxID=267818 RepID=A0AAX3UC97_9LACO|nr:ATP-binding protein [Lactobacillus kefiranofaciens]AEG41229.1 ATPase [Lactobacillus kefiranofaciens subsp. kefiranofaciens]KRM21560.1 ATPase [Lactobacillus kefiranofaciens subsp. kefiranofaciens DSM 5016 = JCM 6985]QFQ68837.1 ATP-binding protein [Lactobacillus kefiranofaciens subsp. kefiranofaciens]WGO85332.1 ATP-binding protein [Lactobacillus kefiranofaciens]WQH35390.1 ATP-binding protein [Lactobacillus kefiranofaciens]
MNPDLLAAIIIEGQKNIRNISIIPRDYHFEDSLNYVLVGLRRSGKSTLLFKRAQDLVNKQNVDWSQIVYLNFEDERLDGFQLSDCNNILIAANQLTTKKHYFLFDEIQNIEGWEKFARRLADQGESVYLTGSNSKVLGHDIVLRLGGRYMAKYIAPFNFSEYLTAKNISHDKLALLDTVNNGQIRAVANEYLRYGGLPESILLSDKRNYLTNIYQNVFLADIIVRNKIRNEKTISLLIRKIADTVMHIVSYANLYKNVKSVINTVSRNAIIDYIDYAKEAYLIFSTKNYFAKFNERESSPKYYFTDNGILNLFYIDKLPALLENIVAIKLHNKYQKKLFYLKSKKTGVDIDFYVPASKTAIQVAWEVNDTSKEREIGNLLKLADNFTEVENLVIVTHGEEETIEKEGKTIQLVPLYKFLLE